MANSIHWSGYSYIGGSLPSKTHKRNHQVEHVSNVGSGTKYTYHSGVTDLKLKCQFSGFGLQGGHMRFWSSNDVSTF